MIRPPTAWNSGRRSAGRLFVVSLANFDYMQLMSDHKRRVAFLKLNERARIPEYKTKGAAGFDFHCTEEVELRSGKVSLVPTGLAVEIPEGYELQIRCRSGLAAKAGCFLVNGLGTIDSDYRGEIKIIMSTCLDQAVHLKVGDRVAQGVLAKVRRAKIVEASELSDTERGDGGFGSTGRV